MGRPTNAERDARRARLKEQQPDAPAASMTPGPMIGARADDAGTLDAADLSPAAGAGKPLAFDLEDGPRERKKENRLNLTLTPDGYLDLDALRDSSRPKVLRALEHGSVRRQLELPPAPAAGSSSTKADPFFTPAQMGQVLDVFGMIQMVVAQRVWGVDEATARAIVPYTRDEKTLIAPSLANIANKRSPEWLKKYADEITLVMMLGSITGQKIAALNDAITKAHPPAGAPRAAAPPPAPAPAPTPTPNNAAPRGLTLEPAEVQRPN